MKDLTNIVIIGAGLCGMLTALYLAKRGFSVTIYEKHAAESSTNEDAYKRAIDLDLSERGCAALNAVNLLQPALALAVPTSARIVSFSDKQELRLPHSPDGQQIIYNIARNDLYNLLLRNVKAHPRIELKFSYRLIDVNIEQQQLIFKLDNPVSTLIVNANTIIGCDGSNSVVRAALEQHQLVTVMKNKLPYQYVNFALPSSFTEKFSTNFMYKWVGDNAALLSHPRVTGSFGTTFIFAQNDTQALAELIQRYPLFASVATTLYEQFNTNPAGRLQSLMTKQQANANILLLGDAAHTMVPFLGQGINCAFEDCYMLNKYLNQAHNVLNTAIQAFIKEREQHTQAILDMSQIEYLELKGKSRREVYYFEYLKKHLAQHYANYYVPYRYYLYFTQIPYHEIKMLQEKQIQLLHRITQNFTRFSAIKWSLVQKWLREMHTAIPTLRHDDTEPTPRVRFADNVVEFSV